MPFFSLPFDSLLCWKFVCHEVFFWFFWKQTFSSLSLMPCLPLSLPPLLCLGLWSEPLHHSLCPCSFVRLWVPRSQREFTLLSPPVHSLQGGLCTLVRGECGLLSLGRARVWGGQLPILGLCYAACLSVGIGLCRSPIPRTPRPLTSLLPMDVPGFQDFLHLSMKLLNFSASRSLGETWKSCTSASSLLTWASAEVSCSLRNDP